MNNIWERERVKLETYEHVGQIIISLMSSGVAVPEALIDRLQREIDFKARLVKALKG